MMSGVQVRVEDTMAEESKQATGKAGQGPLVSMPQLQQASWSHILWCSIAQGCSSNPKALCEGFFVSLIWGKTKPSVLD